MDRHAVALDGRANLARFPNSSDGCLKIDREKVPVFRAFLPPGRYPDCKLFCLVFAGPLMATCLRRMVR